MVTIEPIGQNVSSGIVVYVTFDESDVFVTHEPDGRINHCVALPRLLQRLQYANDAQLAVRFDDPRCCDVPPYLPIDEYERTIRQGSFGLNRGVAW